MENFDVRKILLVDDEQDLLWSLRNYLIETKEIFSEEQVLTASSKAEAIQQLEENEDIDILITGVVMDYPTDGLEVIEYLRKNLNRAMTQVILFTGMMWWQEEEKPIMREYGINYYVEKSGNPDKLFSAIDSARSCLINYYTNLPLSNLSNEKFDVRKILLVDDDKNLLDSLKPYLVDTEKIFSEEQVLTASSKAEAIQQLEENEDIEIIILDVVMESNKSGLEVVEYLRKKLNREMIQIILHTGQAGEIGEIRQAEEVLIKEYDINAFVEKESNHVKFLSALHSALRSLKLLHKIEEQKREIEDLYLRLKDFTLSQ